MIIPAQYTLHSRIIVFEPSMSPAQYTLHRGIIVNESSM